jgi:dTDP-glucose pyrophosphorylase
MFIDSWRHALLQEGATMQQAILNLDKSGLQIVLMVASDGVLLGTITDGDIRRGLLRGLDLNSSAHEIMHREPLVVPPQLNRDTVFQLMQTNQIHQLPVVDAERRVVGLHVLNGFMASAQRPNLMVIMAGGQGTRLLPQTQNCPKSMLPVGGKPMLEHIIERAKAEGFQHFALAIHYLGHVIEQHFGDGSRWQVQIDYLREASPLGTAGAIKLLNPRPASPFIVSNGDVLTNVRYGEMLDFHCHHGAAATMAVRLYEWQHPFGVVHTNGVDIVGFEEKPIARSHVNAGIYALNPSVIDSLNINEPCDMPTIFRRLQEQALRTVAYPVYEPWMDLGQPDALSWARSHWQAA